MTSADCPAPDRDDLKIALDHTWAWFSLHAGQRMQLVNYLLLSSAFVMAGYGTALGAGRGPAAGAIALAGVVVSVAFGALDRRTKALVKAAEAPLLELQNALVHRVGVPSLALVKHVESAAPGTSYSTVLFSLTVCLSLLSAAGAAYGFLSDF